MAAPRSPIPRLRRTTLLGELRDPLFRNGHALVLSSVVTSGVGMLFWLLAAHRYSQATLGRNAVAISTLTFLGGVAQLNLAGALVRFIPTSGRRVLRFVVATYGVSIAVSLALSATFLALIPLVAPSLGFLRASWPLAAWWAVASATWSVFVLEDGALTGLRRSPWVPVENAGFSLLKAGLVAPLAALSPGAGIFLAWTLASLVTIVPTNLYLFGRAIPARLRAGPEGNITARELIAYVPYDYLASLFWLVAIGLLPLVVISRVGPARSAVFNLAWVIAYVFYLVSINLGSSLIVEVAADQTDLARQARRVLAHLAKILVPAVALAALGAPLILRLFGRPYAQTGASTLRLLVASALPFALTSTAVSVLRAKRRTPLVLAVDALICTLVFTGTWVLLPRYGIEAAGYAWLVTQCVVALGIVALAPSWLGLRRAKRPLCRARLVLARLVASLPLPRARHPLRARTERRLAQLVAAQVLPDVLGALHPVARAPERVELEVVPSASDLVVALVIDASRMPVAVVKIAQSDRARRDLETQRQVLAALGADARLGDWRALLPELVLGVRGTTAYALELPLPGLDARRLLGDAPELLPEVAARGVATIGDLHARTARAVRVGEAELDALVAARLGTLRAVHPSGHVPDAQRRAVDLLEQRLRDALIGRDLALAWTHGDFTPGNVMFTSDASRVTGVLDWGQARPDGVPALDVLSWVTALACREEHRELGGLVARLVEGGRWPAETVFGVAQPALDASGLCPRTLVLWSWLEHVAGNLEKSHRYSHHPLWWVANVEPVLAALDARAPRGTCCAAPSGVARDGASDAGSSGRAGLAQGRPAQARPVS